MMHSKGWRLSQHSTWALWSDDGKTVAVVSAIPGLSEFHQPTLIFSYAVHGEGFCVGAFDPAWNLGKAMIAAQAELCALAKGVIA
jgi:hypothetical protein